MWSFFEMYGKTIDQSEQLSSVTVFNLTDKAFGRNCYQQTMSELRRDIWKK